jgi:transcription factor E2F7/8
LTLNNCSFLRLLSNEQETLGIVCVDSAAKTLHVERRLIYDIVNVLESVEIVGRLVKKKYAWYGMTRLPQAIERLRTATLAELNQEPAERQAAEAELASKYTMPAGNTGPIVNASNTGPCASIDAEKSGQSVFATVAPSADGIIEADSQSRAELKVVNLENSTDDCSTEDESCPEKLPMPTALSQEPPSAGFEVPPKSIIIPGIADSQYYAFLEMYKVRKASIRETSLGVLSQKFVQLLINSEHGVVSLEQAVCRLWEEDAINDEGQLRIKTRRLYDIANILCSFNLVSTVSVHKR